MNWKKLITVFLFITFLCGLIFIIRKDDKPHVADEPLKETEEDVRIKPEEVRGVWMSYLELDTILKGKSREEYTDEVKKVIKNLKDLNLNTVILQVRPYSDAIYSSRYFPWSYYCSGEEGKALGYDPLKIFISMAHRDEIAVHGWINPFRVRSANSTFTISETNPAFKWMNDDSYNVIKWNEGVYYNPGSAEVRELIVSGVKELVENYNVDGIHFDDYFYPATDADFDRKSYENYLSSGEGLDLADWRRENINILVKDVYAAIKAVDDSVVFGISPQGSMSNNYNSQYIDVEKWISQKGYVDYLCPQIYYGFKNENGDFKSIADSFNNMVKVQGVKLYTGLAVYKSGMEDSWAGSGRYEWIEDSSIIGRQIDTSMKLSNYGGFLLFRYDSLFRPEESKEQIINDVKNQIKNSKK